MCVLCLQALRMSATPANAASVLQNIGVWGAHEQLCLLRAGIQEDFSPEVQVCEGRRRVYNTFISHTGPCCISDASYW